MELRLRPPYSLIRDGSSAPALCNLEVAWESPWTEFGTSVYDFFAGPRPAKESDQPADNTFRVEWVRSRFPGSAFVASSLWHVAATLILVLPIWGFLPQPQPALPPIQIEVTYVPAQDLPPISLPAPKPKPNTPAKKITVKAETPAEPGADAYDPRQTILSIPVQVTHPRQTLIQPDAPKAAPKIDVQVPNMVQWATPAVPTPELQLTATAAAPAMRQRAVREVEIPEVPNSEKIPADLNIAATTAINTQPKLQMVATAAVATQRQARTDASAAPEIGALTTDENLHRLIALSATPGPAAPVISVPQENLAARVSISPEGKKPGTPGGTAGAGGSPLPASNAGTAAGTNSLPAAISISGGSRPGGIAPALNTGRLNLKPATPDFTVPSRKGPSVVGKIPPNTPPEKILSGKEIYTLNINLPNFTSSAGSWILNFAQLEEPEGLAFHRGQLSGPAPLEKVDPKYPPDLVRDHVEGEVVLYAIIRKDGSIDGIQLVHGVDPELDKDAMEAFARWKFHPGARDGAPVDLEAVVYIPFRYRPPAP